MKPVLAPTILKDSRKPPVRAKSGVTSVLYYSLFVSLASVISFEDWRERRYYSLISSGCSPAARASFFC